jgi:putative peptidoglycan lipid II flippase
MTSRTRPEPAAARSAGAAALVALGILASRLMGLARVRVLAAYFGAGPHADAFNAALRLPNALQNLLGEGTLSASFIPAYSELLGQGRTQEAGRVAGAVFALLLAVAGAVSLLGMLLAPWLVAIFTPGFEGERRELTIAVVRIVFPMTGVLVLSAWALGILNSHRQFFVPYFAPVLWNAAIIGALLAFGARLELDRLLMAAAWGALAGGLLQLGLQLPWVFKLDRELSVRGGRSEPAFKQVLRNAAPAILGRGVVQLSAYVDVVLASLLAIGAVTRLQFAQTLYLLPVSLFGMSVAAAALPELSRDRAGAMGALRERTVAAVRRVAFYVVPSCVAFVLLGDVLTAGLFRTGRFGDADVVVVWLTLAGYSLGLMASTTTRIYQSAFYALRDTRTTARAAFSRVLVAALAGAALMIQFESVTVFGHALPAGLLGTLAVDGIPLGPVGLAIGAALGAWIEWALLRRRLAASIGPVGGGAGAVARMFGAAAVAAGAGYGVRFAAGALAPLPLALLVAAAFGCVYLAAAYFLRLGEARTALVALLRRARVR